MEWFQEAQQLIMMKKNLVQQLHGHGVLEIQIEMDCFHRKGQIIILWLLHLMIMLHGVRIQLQVHQLACLQSSTQYLGTLMVDLYRHLLTQ